MKNFDDLKVSTRTIIATSGVDLEIERVFREIPLSNRFLFGEATHETRIEKMFFKDFIRTEEGVIRDAQMLKSFRNALNVVMVMDGDKKINFKVSKNGKFQLTGCKNVLHAKTGVYSFLSALSTLDTSILDRDEFRVFFEIVMTNVDCGVGYCINRKALDTVINSKTKYNSLLETSFGYTGVNIKFPVSLDWYDLDVPVIKWKKGDIPVETKRRLGSMKERPIDCKNKYNTFLVFHSGQFIMSGMYEDTMREDYNRFMNIIQDNEPVIREQLDAL